MQNLYEKSVKKIVLKVNIKKLTLKMTEIINNKCDPSHISNTVGQYQKPTKNPPRHVFSNFLAKKKKAIVFKA